MPTNVTIPALGESVSQAVLVKWHKQDGDSVKADEPLCELETEKANVDVPSPAAGVLKRTVTEGTTVNIGDTIGVVDGAGSSKPAATPQKSQPAPAPAPKAEAPAKQAEPAPKPVQKAKEPEKVTETVAPVATSSAAAPAGSQEGTRREPMSKIRKKIAERLVSAQHTAAILTTFNEIDLQNVIEIRARFKEKFEKMNGVGLGFMSFFAKACARALAEFPRVNAQIDGNDVIFHDYVNLGIAVSTDRGLAVPVLRNAHLMSFARIESEIKRLAAATREGKLAVEELSGGTFTITNGGIFGSLLSTPILNPPQSGILGMHTIQKRPVAINDKVEIRPMMYVALSYDHRLVDGRESVGFLVRIKELLEDPSRLMLEI
ncbi:MAG TPA: dihydrolipoyllysine-residue succinyltransferase [Tepidisphaeraceae bacterium]|nr:dihydrolipoyllysine-residue succinyltransferase [Tepidisphaeraceae bacterium]